MLIKNSIANCLYTSIPLLLLFLISSCSSNDSKNALQKLSSPNEKISVSIENVDGQIRYSLSKEGKELLSPSLISIFPEAKAVITESKSKTEKSSWKPTWGQFSEFEDHYNELALDVQYGQVKAKLFVRLYDQGVGLRYEIENYKEVDQAAFYCQYQLNSDQAIYSTNKEHEPLGPLALEDLKNAIKPSGEEAHNKESENLKLYIPLVVEQPNTPYLSLLESDLFSAEGFESMKIGYDKESASLVSSSKPKLEGGKLVTPWRVILVNDKIGDLVVNPVTMNLAAPLALEDASWVKPGITLWDWRVHGYTADDGFQYGITTESYKRFIDFQLEMGIAYFLIDDFWYKHVSKGHFELSDNLNLQEVIDYTKEKGTDLLLYYDNRHGSYGDDELFPYYESMGMKGMKYGFMGDNAAFTRMAVKKGAESHLLMDFHDGPTPMTGIERTYPNAVSKEYCHAQQDRRTAFTPEAFVKMALINAIQGPLDMNNGAFDLTGINKGEREKGPKEKDSYLSTVVSEAARTLIIYAGLVCITDAPEAYMKKSDLFEFIRMLPIGKWDDSLVLNAKMGEYITTARSHNGEWFVGSVHDQKGGTLDIALDFLDADKEYQVTYYEDTDETNCVTNPEAYQIRKGTVKKGDIVKAKIAPGGGHCMWIRPSNVTEN